MGTIYQPFNTNSPTDQGKYMNPISIPLPLPIPLPIPHSSSPSIYNSPSSIYSFSTINTRSYKSNIPPLLNTQISYYNTVPDSQISPRTMTSPMITPTLFKNNNTISDSQISFNNYTISDSQISNSQISNSQISPRLMTSPNFIGREDRCINTNNESIHINIPKYLSMKQIISPELLISEISNMIWGVSFRQQRGHEDRYQAKNIGSFKYFAIFDGHGGSKMMDENHVADYCVRYLHEMLAKELLSIDNRNQNNVVQSIHKVFTSFDDEMHRIGLKYGSTCTIILIDYNTHLIYQINLGDSRSIIFNEGGIISATVDHTPNVPEEAKRILDMGGSVIKGRVNGSLAVSRSFGDFMYKTVINNVYTPLVSSTPTITIVPLTSLQNMFCILTSDAPYEKHTYNDASLIHLFQILLATNTLTYPQIAEYMVDIIAPRTSDDTTIIVVKL